MQCTLVVHPGNDGRSNGDREQDSPKPNDQRQHRRYHEGSNQLIQQFFGQWCRVGSNLHCGKSHRHALLRSILDVFSERPFDEEAIAALSIDVA